MIQVEYKLEYTCYCMLKLHIHMDFFKSNFMDKWIFHPTSTINQKNIKHIQKNGFLAFEYITIHNIIYDTYICFSKIISSKWGDTMYKSKEL